MMILILLLIRNFKENLVTFSMLKNYYSNHTYINFPRLFLIIIFLFICISTLHSQIQVFHSPVDGIMMRSGAMSRDAWAFYSNPAGTTTSSGMTAGTGYESSFFMNELSSRTAFVVFPNQFGVVSGGFSQFGFSNYNTQQYSVAFAREMAPWLRLGIKGSQMLKYQQSYGSKALFSVDAGLQIIPSSQISIGFLAVNPARAGWSLNGQTEYLSTWSAASVLYEPSTGLFLEFGLLKEIEESPMVSFGIEAAVHKQVHVRGGASSAPLRLAFGTGIGWEMLRFDMGINHHATLGFSSAFGILYQIKR